MRHCEKCNTEHSGDYGSGRFCSNSCAMSRTRTEETKNRISKGVKNHIIKKSKYPNGNYDVEKWSASMKAAI